MTEKNQSDQGDKWKYIELISQTSNQYGDGLLALMDRYQAKSLQDITAAQAEEFWKQMNRE